MLKRFVSVAAAADACFPVAIRLLLIVATLICFAMTLADMAMDYWVYLRQ